MITPNEAGLMTWLVLYPQYPPDLSFRGLGIVLLFLTLMSTNKMEVKTTCQAKKCVLSNLLQTVVNRVCTIMAMA